jgi:short-subunit dehydrogenase
MHIKGQRIVLTGAASGIGRALLTRLATYPAVRLVAADRDADRLHAAIAAITAPSVPSAPQAAPRAEIVPFVGDLGTPRGVDALFETALQRFGGIDLFIANAGFAYYERLDRADWPHLERIYALNTFSPIYAALKMREINAARPYKVVVTASAMGLLTLPGYALYAASKAAFHHFSEAYRYELPDPRSLLVVYPIGTRTNFFRVSGAPKTWPTQSPEYVAGCILRGIERDQQRVFTSPSFVGLMLAGRIFPPVLRVWQWIELQRFRRYNSRHRSPSSGDRSERGEG